MVLEIQPNMSGELIFQMERAECAPLPAAATGAKKAILAFVFIVLLALHRLSQNLNTTCHLGRQLYFIAAHNAHTNSGAEQFRSSHLMRTKICHVSPLQNNTLFQRSRRIFYFFSGFILYTNHTRQ